MEYAKQCMNMCVVNTRYSAFSERKHSGPPPVVTAGRSLTRGQRLSGMGGIQGVPVMASRRMVMALAPCLVAVDR